MKQNQETSLKLGWATRKVIGVKLSGAFLLHLHDRLLDIEHGIALRLKAFERGQPRTLSILQAGGNDERELRL